MIPELIALFKLLALAFRLVISGALFSGTGPLVIEEPGIYRGVFVSLDPDEPAVVIKTKGPVVLENCLVVGRGMLISTRYGAPRAKPDGVNPLNYRGVDLTVRDCIGFGLRPDAKDRAAGRFIVAIEPSEVHVENNFFASTRGIWVDGGRNAGGTKNIQIVNNVSINADGRCIERCSRNNLGRWVSRNGTAVANLVQVSNTRGAIVNIYKNLSINYPGFSAVEDNINLYNVAGRPDFPIAVHKNTIIGAFPPDSDAVTYSGSGIMIDGGDDPNKTSSYVHVFDNEVHATSNAGIGIAAGNNNAVYNNVVTRTTSRTWHDFQRESVGIYIRHCCGDRALKAEASGIRPFYNNAAWNNRADVRYLRRPKKVVTNNFWLPDCHTLSDGRSACRANSSL